MILYLLGVLVTYLTIRTFNKFFKNDECFKYVVLNDISAVILVALGWIGLVAYILGLFFIILGKAEDCENDNRFIFRFFRKINSVISKMF